MKTIVVSLVFLAAMSAMCDDSFPIETVRGVGMSKIFADGFHADDDFKSKSLHEIATLTNVTQVTVFNGSGHWVKVSADHFKVEEQLVRKLITTNHPLVEKLDLKESVQPSYHIHVTLKGDKDIVLEIYRHLNCAIVYKGFRKYFLFLKWTP